jgi:transposase
MKRYDFSDPQWALLAPFFPRRPRQRGGQWRDDRTLRNGIFGRLNTAAPWRDLPQRFGPWQAVSHRFKQMRHSGRLDRIIERLQLRLHDAGPIEPALFGKAPSAC